MGEEKPRPGRKKPPEKKKRTLAPGDLMMAVIRSGEGSKNPTDDDLVVFHCATLTEDGQMIRSTRPEHGGKQGPVKLVMGKSKMIIAWEEGLQNMTKGEVTRFKVKPALHYGDPECPVPVPENFPTDAVLLFDIELIDFYPVKVVTDDFGVLKQMISDGVGWETPREPYEVLARSVDNRIAVPAETSLLLYVIDGVQRNALKIVGRVSDKDEPFIVRREEPLFFTMGKHEIPDGLEQGIGTMTKNEKANIYISGTYITKASAIPELPIGVSEVQFEVELVQVIQVRDMLGEGSVIKRRTRDGRGDFPVDCPLQDSKLRIRYKGMLPSEGDKVFYDTRKDLEGGELEFDSGEGMVPEGLEMCIRLMLPGEISIIHSVPAYAYDKFPRPALVPEGAAVKWEVELLSFEKRKDWTGFSFKEIMDDTEKQKATGNRLFKEGKFELAKAKYEFLLREFKHVNPHGDQEVEELGKAQLSLQLNVVACFQKQGEYVKAIEACDKVLEGNPHHVKALYRRGLAYTSNGDFEEARNDFNKMITVDQSSEPDASAALSKLKKKEQEAELRARKQFKGLFDKSPGLLSEPVEQNIEQPVPSGAAREEDQKVAVEERKKEQETASERTEGTDGGLAGEEEDPFANARRRKTSPSYFRSLLNRFSQRRCSIL